jgi:hypothetical protein
MHAHDQARIRRGVKNILGGSKTELAKTLASTLFDSEDAVIRIDTASTKRYCSNR